MARVNTQHVQDERSTGRKRGRKALFESGREFKCVGVPEKNIVCGKTTAKPPPDAPRNFEDMWPEELRVLSQLQVDHENKEWMDNDPANLEWRCASCHRIHDNMSGVGESTVADLSGYRPLR